MATLNTPRSRDSFKNKGVRRPVGAGKLILSTTGFNDDGTSGINIADENPESVIFIWFDPHEQSNLNLIGPLRAINNSVQAFTDASTCFDVIRSSKEKIFFICSSSNNELLTAVHEFPAVEAIFIVSSNAENIKGDFPKLFGIFTQQEELFRMLKEVFDIFEQAQLEEFAFGQDKVFLWSQLWREELSSRKVSSNKQAFIEVAQCYYRDNMKINEHIGEFEKSYRPAEAVNWCCRSSFPARFLLHALRFHSKAQLHVSRFLFADVSRFFQQQPKRKSGDQFYRGMKLSSALLEQFEAHVDKLVCTSGFFPCTKSRVNALTFASLPAYRPDLRPVFFKIDCDASSPYAEVSQRQSSPIIIFDTCIAFRVVYVKRDQMSVIKLKTAGEAGKKIALDFMKEHNDEPIQSMLDELLKPPKPPTPPPPPRLPTPPPVKINVSPDPIVAVEEIKAKKYAETGDVDLAIITYRRIEPMTARVLIAIARLCADRKGDYEYALQCLKQALKKQEKSGEDMSETLTHLGNVHHSRGEYDLALYYHKKALELRQSNPTTGSATIVSSFLGLANAHLARGEHSEAIANATQALALQEALVPPSETDVATTLALLGNIYRDSGDTTRALDAYTKALIIFERISSVDSLLVAELLRNLGTIQSHCGALVDAQLNLERALKIFRKFFARGHPDRNLTENELQRIVELRQKNKENFTQQ